MAVLAPVLCGAEAGTNPDDSPANLNQPAALPTSAESRLTGAAHAAARCCQPQRHHAPAVKPIPLTGRNTCWAATRESWSTGAGTGDVSPHYVQTPVT